MQLPDNFLTDLQKDADFWSALLADDALWVEVLKLPPLERASMVLQRCKEAGRKDPAEIEVVRIRQLAVVTMLVNTVGLATARGMLKEREH